MEEQRTGGGSGRVGRGGPAGDVREKGIGDGKRAGEEGDTGEEERSGEEKIRSQGRERKKCRDLIEGWRGLIMRWKGTVAKREKWEE